MRRASQLTLRDRNSFKQQEKGISVSQGRSLLKTQIKNYIYRKTWQEFSAFGETD